MTFTADQYAQIARRYDSAASDPFVPADKREEFAKQAEWFHYLSTREKSKPAHAASEKVFSERPRGFSRAVLTTLWLTGAATYLIGTLLFTNAVGLFGDRDGSSQVAKTTLPVERSFQPASIDERATAGGSDSNVMAVVGERRHAVSPDQPPYESPQLIEPLPEADQNEVASPVDKPAQNLSASSASASEPEKLKVIKAATIRNGPSSRSKVIGTATPGAELQVKGRENGWIEFVDPSSGNRGWIEANLVAGTLPIVANDTMGIPPDGDSKRHFPKKKKTARQKPANVARPPEKVLPKPERGYAGLPEDEAFLIERGARRMGILARRRMLRQGLMSPGFTPPD